MNKLLIFGCGELGKKTYKFISKTRNKVLYYIDNDTEKRGKYIFGKKIIAPDDIVNLEYDYILIASVFWREMRKQLLDLGVRGDQIKCPGTMMKLKKFKAEYREIYNIRGKIKFYYDRWYLTEQFHPDFMGVFVNPYYFSRKMLYENMKKYSHYITGKCMDFGCGISPYKSLLSVDEYVGVEIDTNDKKPGITYYDGYKLPFKDENFDSIISSEVFEHVVNIEDIVSELNRVIKSGGMMLLSVPFAYPKHCEPFDYQRWTLAGIKNLLENAGFEFVEGKASSSYWECIAQFQNVYWAEEVIAKTKSGKLLKNIILVFNNLSGALKKRVFPYSDKLYLDNIIIVKKSNSNKR